MIGTVVPFRLLKQTQTAVENLSSLRQTGYCKPGLLPEIKFSTFAGATGYDVSAHLPTVIVLADD